MKRKRYTKEQIISILQQHEAGRTTVDLAREYGIAEKTMGTLAVFDLSAGTRIDVDYPPVELPVRHEALFQEFSILEMREPVFLAAAALRAGFSLKIPDALHLACAQDHGCDALWTNDERMMQADHGLARNILD